MCELKKEKFPMKNVQMLDVDERQVGIGQVSVCLTMSVLSNAGEIRRQSVALVSPAFFKHQNKE